MSKKSKKKRIKYISIEILDNGFIFTTEKGDYGHSDKQIITEIIDLLQALEDAIDNARK